MSSTRKRTANTANTSTFMYDQSHARTKRAKDEANKRLADAVTLEDIKKLKNDVLTLTAKQVKYQGIIRNSIVKYKMKNLAKPRAETEDEQQQLMKYASLIKKTKDKIASLEKSMSLKGGRRKRRTMKGIRKKTILKRFSKSSYRNRLEKKIKKN